MIKGMTGFGSSQMVAGQVRGIIEVKSVNHRYLDLMFYLPIGFGSVEDRIRDLVEKTASRGRITVSFKITEKPQHKLSFNREAVTQYLTYARSLKKDFHLQNDLTLSDLIKLPGVVESQEAMVNPAKIWPFLEKSMTQALASMDRMRKREGLSLAKDINSVLKRMLKRINEIETREAVVLKQKKKEMTDEEFLNFQKGVDVNEEMARLKHYIEEFKNLSNSTVSVGKKLDFVAQEMQRETNTIGSKFQDKIVSNCVIALKSKIEKLREQAQNVE